MNILPGDAFFGAGSSSSSSSSSSPVSVILLREDLLLGADRFLVGLATEISSSDWSIRTSESPASSSEDRTVVDFLREGAMISNFALQSESL